MFHLDCKTCVEGVDDRQRIEVRGSKGDSNDTNHTNSSSKSSHYSIKSRYTFEALPSTKLVPMRPSHP